MYALVVATMIVLLIAEKAVIIIVAITVEAFVI